jgi:hypothetical protein
MENEENEKHHVGEEKLGHEEKKDNKEDKSDLKLKGLEDKRPDDPNLEKGWGPDSDTSRGPEDLQSS